MAQAEINLDVRKGETFGRVLAWGQGSTAYAAITDILKRAPCRITAPDHGLPDGWVVQIESVKGLRGINQDGFQPVHVVDDDTVELPEVNAAMLRGEYAGGGYLVFNKPMDLTGYDARMQIREFVEADDVILELTRDNGGLVIDSNKSAVAILIESEQTEDLPYLAGVYDLEMIAPGGDVHVLAQGGVTFHDEVTRD